MALNFSFKKVKGHPAITTTKNEKGEDVWTNWAQTIPWVCMAVGIGTITQANREDFFKRARMWEKAVGHFLRINEDAGIVDHPITQEIVDQYVGTWTNVTTIPYRDFVHKLAAVVLEDKLGYRLPMDLFEHPLCGKEHPDQSGVYCRKDEHLSDGDYEHDDMLHRVWWEDEDKESDNDGDDDSDD